MSNQEIKETILRGFPGGLEASIWRCHRRSPGSIPVLELCYGSPSEQTRQRGREGPSAVSDAAQDGVQTFQRAREPRCSAQGGLVADVTWGHVPC